MYGFQQGALAHAVLIHDTVCSISCFTQFFVLKYFPKNGIHMLSDLSLDFFFR